MTGAEQPTPPGNAAPTTHALPPRLRARVVALASQGLSRVPPAHVPAALRRSASFAPAKRAKLVAGDLAGAVDDDDEFREHLATQVRAIVPTATASLESDTPPVTVETLAETAAAAFLLRTEGWESVVQRAIDAEEERRDAPGGDLAATVEKLQAALTSARSELKSAREKMRTQVAEVKADNAALRRTLGQTRQQLKQAQETAASVDSVVESVRRESEIAQRAAEAESRRLRARVERLESHTTSARRAVREDREAETMRLRLLLDTVMDSAAGLRRELALPPSEMLPADTVRAVEPGVDPGVAGVGRALLGDDPMLLRRLLEVPRAHLIIDGYNVSKTAWPTAPLEEQRNRLGSRVAALVAGKGIETTIVFDGADLKHPPSVSPPRGIRVLFSPPGVIADDTIRHLVTAEPLGRPLVVVSTDREIAESVTKMGARSVTSQALVAAMGV
jgi:predicted RNA-binding protein with PIN domain/phage shock protein A